MEWIAVVNDKINSVVWGAPVLALLMGAGLLLTIRTGGIQFRRFGYAMANTLGKVFRREGAGEGELTPFQAMTTALAGTVGTGSIAGVTAAVTLGGPGAIFWLWVSALIGMATKYAEVLLAVKYREKTPQGQWVGGPMYYIRGGLGKGWAWLGTLFCLFTILASFGTGNAVQVGTITSSVVTVIRAFVPGFSPGLLTNLAVGGTVALLTGVVLFGGIKRLGAVTERLVPAMAAVYVLASLAVVGANLSAVPGVFGDIFRGAFSPTGVTGGAVGSGLLALSWGVKRGIFSNEAGLGSAPMAHAATSQRDPVLQGLYGIFEVFTASFVICTLTGVALLCSGIPLSYGVMGDTSLNAAALGTVFGARGGSVMIALGISLFAFSTILGWSLYGASCCQYLWGSRTVLPFRLAFLGVTAISAVVELSLVWDIADTLNGLMALPNLVGLVGLSGVAARETRRHFDGKSRNT